MCDEHRSTFAYGGEHDASLATACYRVASATVTGSAHLERGLGCDDAAAAAAEGEWLVAVVCDGAGSAACGGRGAALAAAQIAEHLLAAACAAAGDAEGLPAAELSEPLVRAALAQARDALVAEADREGTPIDSLATTVVGLLWGRAGAAIFQVGDGAAIAFAPGQQVAGVSLGRPSEYANETYFLTDRSWDESLTVETFDGVESVLLMTDGVTPFALRLGEPKSEFHAGVLDFLARKDVDEGAAALQRLLRRDAARTQIGDDKTLLWASRRPASEQSVEAARGMDEPTELAG